MKIVLIMTKGNTYSFNNRSVFFKYMPDSLTMGVLVAIIQKNFPDIEVEFYDETVGYKLYGYGYYGIFCECTGH